MGASACVHLCVCTGLLGSASRRQLSSYGIVSQRCSKKKLRGRDEKCE